MPRPDRPRGYAAGGRGPGAAARPPALGDALAWLDRHVNLEAIESGRAGRPSLERMRALVGAMGEPQRCYPIVHVTGTNGKGSTTRLVASLLGARGLRVGTYTSPHLERVNERVSVAGEPVSDDALAALLGALEQLEGFLFASADLEDRPTWFEVVTAAAFRHFADEAVDAASVEVGLGGRYDATNVADGAVAVLTNVALDHVEILGPTREAIAAEKSGIVKEGAVAVVGERDEGIVALVEAAAREVGARDVWRLGEQFGVSSNRLAVGGRLVDLWTPGARYADLFLPLHGPYQATNAALALAAAEAFFGAPLDAEVVAEGFATVRVPGRMEVLHRRPLVVLDGAHNAAGAEAAGRAVREDFAAARRTVLVMGCLRGRDPGELLAGLADGRVEAVVACTPGSPRALPAESVAAAATAAGWRAEVVPAPDEALWRALELVGEDDLVLVTGSLYVVGAVRAAWRAARGLSGG